MQAVNGSIYTCVVSNAAGSDSSSTFVYISPHFVTQPMSMSVDNGTSIGLLCEVEAFPNPSIQWWRVDGEPIRDGIVTDTQILFIDPVLFGDEGEYYCNASSLDTIIRSESATITSMFLVSISCPIPKILSFVATYSSSFGSNINQSDV